MLRIDAHHHLWDERVRAQDWMDDGTRRVIGGPYDMGDWTAAASPAGVRFGVFVQTVAQPEETPEILALADGHDALAGVVGWIDVHSDRPAGELLDELRDGPGGQRLVGVRVLAEYVADENWLAGKAVRAAAGAIAERDLSLDLLTGVRMLAAAERLAEASPDTRLVLDHLSKPTMDPADFDVWARDIRALGRHPQVACKLSGYLTFGAIPVTAEQLRPYADTVLDAFGPARTMFGSDWPVCVLAGGYSRVVEVADQLLSGLSDGERADVWAGTARRWYPAMDAVVMEA